MASSLNRGFEKLGFELAATVTFREHLDLGVICSWWMSKLTLSIAAIMTLWAFPENRTFIRFDAKWWHHTNSDEQQGFIYGYRDCRQPPDAPKVSINDEQSFVSMTLDSHKSDAPDAVTAALHLAWKTMKSQAIEKGAEVFAGPHGFLDG